VADLTSSRVMTALHVLGAGGACLRCGCSGHGTCTLLSSSPPRRTWFMAAVTAHQLLLSCCNVLLLGCTAVVCMSQHAHILHVP
jgi:hypothetical protein